MTASNHPTLTNSIHGQYVDVAGIDLIFKRVLLDDIDAVGSHLVRASGFDISRPFQILAAHPDGSVTELDQSKAIQSMPPETKFVFVERDETHSIAVDGHRFSWPGRHISGAAIRLLASTPDHRELFLEHSDQPDEAIAKSTIVDLSKVTEAAFYSRSTTWGLNLQGVRLELHQPTVEVREAIKLAGLDPTQGWQIFLKIAGHPKQAVDLDFIIDLRTPGIEKLRLTPKDVSNGEGQPQLRYEFTLLDVDEDFLDKHHLAWETVQDNNRRWLIIYNYPIPSGYSANCVMLSLEIPPDYPGAQIDMFYVAPPLVQLTGVALPNTEHREKILGKDFQRWSRHRGTDSAWNAATDNVITHLALVEGALRKEVQQ